MTETDMFQNIINRETESSYLLVYELDVVH